MLAFNVDQICYIKIFPKQESGSYKIIPESKNWFGRVKPERVVHFMADSIFVEDFLEKSPKHRVEDGIIYYKPHVKIHFSNDRQITQFFESVDEMNFFIETELGSVNLKIIE